MKTLLSNAKKLRCIFYTVLCTVLIYSGAMAQITIEPSKGDRFSYYLNGDVWESSMTHKTEFVLKVFMADDIGKSVWIQNFSLNEKEFIKLMITRLYILISCKN